MSPSRDQREDPSGAELQMLVRERLASIDDKLDKILVNLHGDGDRAGLYTRVDRLEVAEANRKVWTGSAIAAGVASLVASLWALLTHNK